MPNWSYNAITVEGLKPNVIEAIKALYQVKERRTISLHDKLSANGVATEHLKDEPKEGFYIAAYGRYIRALIDGKVCTQEAYKEVYDKAYAEALEAVKADKPVGEPRLTFDVVVPMPDECLVDCQNTIHPDGVKGDCMGADGWYGWSCNNWGTKWDMCDADIDRVEEQLKEIEEDGDDDTVSVNFCFQTAWSAPLPFITAYSAKFPNVSIRIEAEEESNAFLIDYKYEAGELVEEHDFDSKVDWLINNSSDIDHIIEDMTYGYESEAIEDFLDGNLDNDVEELIQKLENAGYTDVKDKMLSAFDYNPDNADEEYVALIEKVKEAITEVFTEREGTNVGDK